MNPGYSELQVGWQSSSFRIVVAGVVLLATLASILLFGPLGAVAIAVLAPLCAVAGMQWAAIDGAILQLRDLRTGFGYRLMPARHFDRVVYRRSALPWSRLRMVREPGRAWLEVRARRADTPALRQLTLWMIVHGRRRASIDPCLLDALAAMPEHGEASQPRDASHA